jgi:hypothetical protein
MGLEPRLLAARPPPCLRMLFHRIRSLSSVSGLCIRPRNAKGDITSAQPVCVTPRKVEANLTLKGISDGHPRRFQGPAGTTRAFWSTTSTLMMKDYETAVVFGTPRGTLGCGTSGNGYRLRSLSRRIAGDKRPKQFCDILSNGSTLLQGTANRVNRNILHDQIAYVVTRSHEPYYKQLLEEVHPARVFEQPANRGTGVAILFSILKVIRFVPPR